MPYALTLGLFLTSFIFANEVEINVLKIKLSSVDALGMIKVNGSVKLMVNTINEEPTTIKSDFSVKTAGIGIAKTERNSYKIEYNKVINLIQGDNVILPGFNRDAVLTSVIIDQPVIVKNNEFNYDLKINFLKAFGKAAPSHCQEYEVLDFLIQQKGLEFQLYFPGIESPIHEVQLLVETLNKDKKLSRIEIRSKDKKSIVEFKDCKRVIAPSSIEP